MWPLGRAWEIFPSKGRRVTIKMYCGDLMELKTTIFVLKRMGFQELRYKVCQY
jgi:hypothetical protein